MRTIFLAISLIFCATTFAPAGVVLTDIEHSSDIGGVWNNNNAGNWGIWIASGSDPSLTTAGQVLNPGNPVNQPVNLPNGLHTYVLLKEQCCASASVVDVFDFQDGVTNGTISVPNNGPYVNANVPPAAVSVPTLVLPKVNVTLSHLSWYNPSVFNKDLVGSGQSFGASGTADHVGLVTLNVVPEPVVAHYQFNDPLNLANDSSLHGYHGTVNGATAAAGILGGAISVSGGNNVVTGNLTQSMNGSASMSIATWFNATPAAGGGVIVSEIGQVTPNIGWHDSQIELQADGTLKNSVWDRGGVNTSAATSAGWHHAVLSYDATTGTLTSYLDGVVYGTTTFTRQTPWNNGYQQFYAFGAPDTTHLGNGAGFDGLIDDVQIYNVALNAYHVNYLLVNPGATVPEPSSLALIGLGVTVAMAWQRRYKRVST